MFWQGGGKKRMQEIITSRLQCQRDSTSFDNLDIARTDDQLLLLYYNRNDIKNKEYAIGVNDPLLQERRRSSGKIEEKEKEKTVYKVIQMIPKKEEHPPTTERSARRSMFLKTTQYETEPCPSENLN